MKAITNIDSDPESLKTNEKDKKYLLMQSTDSEYKDEIVDSSKLHQG